MKLVHRRPLIVYAKVFGLLTPSYFVYAGLPYLRKMMPFESYFKKMMALQIGFKAQKLTCQNTIH